QHSKNYEGAGHALTIAAGQPVPPIKPPWHKTIESLFAPSIERTIPESRGFTVTVIRFSIIRELPAGDRKQAVRCTHLEFVQFPNFLFQIIIEFNIDELELA